jgi:RNA polymerase sigma-70 factor (ECF subfamily)
VREARRCAPADLAEDVAHEALLKAWRYRANCRRADAPAPWVTAIVRQEAARRRASGADLPDAEIADRADAAAPDLLDRLAMRIDLVRALRTLSDDERRLVWLRYGDDLTQPAAAEALGVPEGTVKVRLHRLRRRLRAELEPR